MYLLTSNSFLSKLNGILERKLDHNYLETEFHGGDGAEVFLLSQALYLGGI